jgi:replicative DNA helicase
VSALRIIDDKAEVTAERIVLGVVLDGQTSLADVQRELEPADFGRPRHREIFDAMLAVAARHEQPLTVAVHQELARRGDDHQAELFELANEAVTGDVTYYVNEIKCASKRRSLAQLLRANLDALAGGADPAEVAEQAAARCQDLATLDVLEPAPQVASDAFPVDALPPVVAAFVAGVARAHGVDPAFVGLPALAALAGAVAATRRVIVKPGSWTEPAHIWVGVIASSGAGKSPAQAAALEPLRRRDAELAQRTKLEQETYRAALAAWRAGGGQGDEPAAPPQRQALLDDCTVEAAVARLADNPRGLLLAVDELSLFARSFDKYRSGGGDLSRWLQIHGGSSIRVDRKGAGSVYVERAVVGVVGGIQPSVAQTLLASPEHALSGFTARFALAMPPTSPARWTDDTVSAHVATAYRRVCDGLLDLELLDGQPVDLLLSTEGRAVFMAWHDELADEAHGAAHAGDEALAAAFSKWKGVTARIALVLQLAEDAEQGTASLTRTVNSTAVERAVQLARYFKNEARRINIRWSASAPNSNKSVLDVLTDEWRPKRELHQQLGNRMNGAEIDAVLGQLAASGQAETTKRHGRGRPAELWRRATKQANKESRPAPHQTDQRSPDPRGGV